MTTTRILDIKRDNRTMPERQAAKLLGVKLKNAATEVRTVYGREQRYAQIWWVEGGRNLVIAADNHKLSAALVSGDFEWDHSVANELANYTAMAEAAGLSL